MVCEKGIQHREQIYTYLRILIQLALSEVCDHRQNLR